MISMVINMVFHVTTVVLSNNNIFNCDFLKFCSTSLIIFYNKLIETDIGLVEE